MNDLQPGYLISKALWSALKQHQQNMERQHCRDKSAVTIPLTVMSSGLPPDELARLIRAELEKETK